MEGRATRRMTKSLERVKHEQEGTGDDGGGRQWGTKVGDDSGRQQWGTTAGNVEVCTRQTDSVALYGWS